MLAGCQLQPVPYAGLGHASNAYCGKLPFDGQCRETDWNYGTLGVRAVTPSHWYLDVKAFQQIGDQELEGKGPHFQWEVGKEFR